MIPRASIMGPTIAHRRLNASRVNLGTRPESRPPLRPGNCNFLVVAFRSSALALRRWLLVLVLLSRSLVLLSPHLSAQFLPGVLFAPVRCLYLVPDTQPECSSESFAAILTAYRLSVPSHANPPAERRHRSRAVTHTSRVDIFPQSTPLSSTVDSPCFSSTVFQSSFCFPLLPYLHSRVCLFLLHCRSASVRVAFLGIFLGQDTHSISTEIVMDHLGPSTTVTSPITLVWTPPRPPHMKKQRDSISLRTDPPIADAQPT